MVGSYRSQRPGLDRRVPLADRPNVSCHAGFAAIVAHRGGLKASALQALQLSEAKREAVRIGEIGHIWYLITTPALDDSTYRADGNGSIRACEGQWTDCVD